MIATGHWCCVCEGGRLQGRTRAHTIAELALQWRLCGPIEGSVVTLDSSVSDVPRVALNQERIENVLAYQRHQRVRQSLHGDPAYLVPRQKSCGHSTSVAAATLVEPGELDFGRNEWFQKLAPVCELQFGKWQFLTACIKFFWGSRWAYRYRHNRRPEQDGAGRTGESSLFKSGASAEDFRAVYGIVGGIRCCRLPNPALGHSGCGAAIARAQVRCDLCIVRYYDFSVPLRWECRVRAHLCHGLRLAGRRASDLRAISLRTVAMGLCSCW